MLVFNVNYHALKHNDNIDPQKCGLCWSINHIYPLYLEPLNTNLTSILSQHVRVFF